MLSISRTVTIPLVLADEVLVVMNSMQLCNLRLYFFDLDHGDIISIIVIMFHGQIIRSFVCDSVMLPTAS